MERMALNWEREAFMHLPGPEGASERTLGDVMEAQDRRGRHLCTFQDLKGLLRDLWGMLWKHRLGEGGIYAPSRT